MNKKLRVFVTAILAIAFVTSAAISAFLALIGDPSRSVFGEWLAPVNINVEIDKNVIGNISILSEPVLNACYYLSPTGESAGEKTVIHTELRSNGFHRRIFCVCRRSGRKTLLRLSTI